jgi:hypothetical protein
MEALQGRVCAKEVTSLRLLSIEQESLVNGVEFSHTHTIQMAQTV